VILYTGKVCEKAHCKVSVCIIRCKVVEKQINVKEDESVIYNFDVLNEERVLKYNSIILDPLISLLSIQIFLQSTKKQNIWFTKLIKLINIILI